MRNEKITLNEYDPFHPIESKSNIASKSRIILSQCAALLAIDLMKFAHGYFAGFGIVLLSLMYKENAEISMTLAELTWFGSSCFMIPVGSVLGGIIAYRIGSRLMCIIATFVFATCALLYHFANSSAMLLLAQATTGLIAGMFKGPSFTYVAEITQPYLRSTLMATSNFSLLLGMFTGTIVSGHLYWRNAVLINLVFITFGLIFISFIPESPHWLASKHRYYEAKLALAWFRGWTSPENVEVEFQGILKNLKNLSSAFSTKPTDDDVIIDRLKSRSQFKDTLKALGQKTFYIPMLTISYIFLIDELGGGLTVKFFSMLIFKKIDSPMHAHTASSILMAIPIVGAISVILTVHLIGKRKLAFVSLAGCGLCYLVAGGYGFLKAQNFCISEHPALNWIPTVCVLVATLLASMGLDKIVFMWNSELFPTRFRQIGSGIGHSLNSLFVALLSKLFLYMVNEITMPGVLLFFAAVNIVGFVTIYFIIPETEGKSLKEIEDHYSGLKCFREMRRIDNKDRVTEKIVVRRPLFRAVPNPM